MGSISTDISSNSSVPNTPTRSKFLREIVTFPWWLVAMIALGIGALYLVTTNQTYTNIFNQLRSGIRVTLTVSFVSYAMAIVIGLIIGIIRSYPPTEKSGPLKVIGYHAATFYLEVFRGLPILVVLLIITFVAVPKFITFFNGLGLAIGETSIEIDPRKLTYMWRAIIALSLTYGAFLSEVFRSGIQSIERGQIEAAQAIGLRGYQIMRFVVLPQATKRVLPPLGNDLIAMIKDSSLVAILAVRDITQLSKLSAGQSFLYLETYMVAAVIYLSMTVIGSLLVRVMESKLGKSSH